MTRAPVFLVLCGPTGCGKSTLAENLRNQLGAARCAVLSMDHYYRDLSGLPEEQRAQRNFDVPEAMDIPLLHSHLRKLEKGETILRPAYDFKTHTRLPVATEFSPRDVVVIEGIFACALVKDVLQEACVVYLDLPVQDCLERRIGRDLAERGRSREEIEARFRRDILPSLQSVVLPQKLVADVVADAKLPPEVLCQFVLRQLPGRFFARQSSAAGEAGALPGHRDFPVAGCRFS